MGHNVKLHSRTVVPLPMARTILECYLEARKEGLPVIQSKRWGIYQAEAIRFGGWMETDRLKSKRREKTVWWNGTSKHAKTEIFDRLMKNTLGTTRFLGKPKTVDNWMLFALRRHDKKIYADLRQAAKNYRNILGNAPSPVNARFLDVYRKWLKIDRGRKLFVRGFGKFEISAAVEKLKVDYVHSEKYVFAPADVTAAGYRINRWRFQSLIKTPILRTYYLKFKSFWSGNENRLDELWSTFAEQQILDNPDIPPETLLRRLDVERERQRLQYDRYGYRATSPEPFAHLAAAPEVDTPFGTLRPVKSPQEVMEVAREMKNCATTYIGSIREKSSLLLALFDESGRPIALGEVHYDRTEKRWIWGQRLGPENKNLEKALYEVFQKYPLASSGIWEYQEDLIGS